MASADERVGSGLSAREEEWRFGIAVSPTAASGKSEGWRNDGKGAWLVTGAVGNWMLLLATPVAQEWRSSLPYSDIKMDVGFCLALCLTAWQLQGYHKTGSALSKFTAARLGSLDGRSASPRRRSWSECDSSCRPDAMDRGDAMLKCCYVGVL